MPPVIPDNYFGKWSKNDLRLLIVVVVDGIREIDTHSRQPFQQLLLKTNMARKIPFRTSGDSLTVPGHIALATGVIEKGKANDGSQPSQNPTFIHRILSEMPDVNGYFICSKGKLQNALSSPFHQHLMKDTRKLHLNFGQGGSGIGYRKDDKTRVHVLQAINEASSKTNGLDIIFINLHETDTFAHMGDNTKYKNAIINSDAIIEDIFKKSLQKFPNKFAMFVTSDHGRHTSDFSQHGCTCEGCENISLFAFGPEIKGGYSEKNNYGHNNPYTQIDLYTTIMTLLGSKGPLQPKNENNVYGKFIYNLFE